MNTAPIKSHWLDRAIQVYKFHCNQCKDEAGWTIEKSAKALNRSVGSVSQDLLLATWSRTHEKQLKRFRSMKDALAFVRSKERDIRLGGL